MIDVKKFSVFGVAAVLCGGMLLYSPHDIPGSSYSRATYAAVTDVPIDEAHFPDEIFRAYVDENFDTTDDNVLSAKEIAAVTEIAVPNLGIADLSGVAYFSSLKTLKCGSNRLTTLDVTGCDALEYLDCSFNELTSLNVSDNLALEGLQCTYNKLTDLTVSANTALKELSCSFNQLTALNVSSNTVLESLYCSLNQLTALDVTNNTALHELGCSDNLLTSLDLSKNTALERLSCYSNSLAELDLSKQNELVYLYCASNLLTTLELNHLTALTYLNCKNNSLWKLDLPKNFSGTLNYDDIRTVSVDGMYLDLSVYGLNASDFYGGTLSDDGILTPTLSSDTDGVAYIYPMGNDESLYLIINFSVAVNADNFPDRLFRAYVDENFDTTDDDVLTLDEIAAVTKLQVGGMGISDLSGIEFFPKLTVLECYKNSLTKLDMSYNTALQYLDCNNNQITALTVSKNTELQYLNCSNNRLTALNVGENTALQYLDCSYNQLTALNVGENTALQYLNCTYNQLTALDASQNTVLHYLDCNNNQIAALNVGKNTALQYLDCSYNQLTALNVGENTALQYLDCSYNQLTALNVGENTALHYLDCSYNLLAALDVSGCSGLKELICYDTYLTSLDLSVCTSLTVYEGSHRAYSIALKDGQFNLSNLPGTFDVTRASAWTNATVEGKLLTVIAPDQLVTYSYAVSDEITEVFSFDPDVAATAIVSQPADAYAEIGAVARTTVKATGDGLTYTWYVKDIGSTAFVKSSLKTAIYSFAMTEAKDGRQVYCVITDAYGNQVTTNTVTFYAKYVAAIVSQPADAYAEIGAVARTTVKAAGDGLTYTWYVKDVGSTAFVKSSLKTATYSFAMTEAKDGRQVYCVITDAYGNQVTTNTVTFYAKYVAAIVSQPADAYAEIGAVARTTVKATGDGLTYTWYVKDIGSTAFVKSSLKTATYSFAMTEAKDGRQVYCVITDAYGNQVISDTVTFHML